MRSALKRFLVYSLLLLVLIVATAGYVVYDELSDLDQIKAVMVKELEARTHHKVAIGEARLSLVEGLSVNLQNVSLRHIPRGHAEFTAKNVWVIMKLWPLLNGEVKIQKVIVEDSLVQIMRDAEGEFSYEDFPIPGFSAQAKARGDGVGKLLQFGGLHKVEMRNGELRFLDYYRRSQPAEIHLKKIHFAIEKRYLRPPYHFIFHGEIPESGRGTRIDLSGRVNPSRPVTRLADLSVTGKIKIEQLYWPRVKKLLSREKGFPLLSSLPEDSWVSLESTYSLQDGGRLESEGKLKYTIARRTARAEFRSPADHSRGAIQYKVKAAGGRIEFDRFRYRSGEFELQARAVLTGLDDKSPKIRLTVESNQFLADHSDRYPPLKLLPPKVHLLLQKVFKKGTIEAKEIKFDGTLDQFRNITDRQNLKLLNGDLILRNVDWSRPLPPFTSITGIMGMRDGDTVIDVYDAHYHDLPVSRLQGKIKDVAAKPTLEWVAESPLQLVQLQRTLPKIMDNPALARFLDGYENLKGEGRLVVNVEGPLKKFHQIRFFGGLTFAQGAFTRPGGNLPVTGLKGEARFDIPVVDPGTLKNDKRPWSVTFQELSGDYGEEPFTHVKGELNLERGRPYLRLAGELELNPVASAERWISHASLDKKWRGLARQIDFLDGKIRLRFQMQGNPLEPEKNLKKGFMELKNLAMKLPPPYQPLMNLNGAIEYSGGRVTMKNIQAYYGNSPVRLKGTFDRKKPARVGFDVAADSPGFYATDLKGIPYLESFRFAGPVKSRLVLRGTPENFVFEQSLDLTQASYTLKDVLEKTANQPNRLTFRGSVSRGHPIRIKRMAVRLGENEISGQGVLKSLEDPDFTVNLAGKEFKTADMVPPLEIFGGQTDGRIDFTLKAKGHLRRIGGTRYEGVAKLTRLVFRSKNLVRPLILNGNIKFSNKKIEFKTLDLAAGNSRFRVAGAYRPGKRPDLQLDLEGKSLVLADFVLPGKGFFERIRPLVRDSRLLSQGTSRITWNLDRLNHEFWRLNHVTGKVSFQDRKLKVHKLDIHTRDNKRIQGQGTLSLDDPRALHFESYLVARDLRAKNFLNLFGSTFDGGLSGKFKTLELILKGKGNDWKEMKRSLVGKVSFDLALGMINTGRLKRGIKELIGLPGSGASAAEPEKITPYERIVADFSIRQGVAETQNFIFDTNRRSATLVGWFDLNRYEMDSIVGVAPLPALDKFLVKIPLVGKIITAGDEESLVKSYYSVRGRFADPEIIAIPLTSLEKKVMGIFKGILQTPQQIFTLPNETPAK